MLFRAIRHHLLLDFSTSAKPSNANDTRRVDFRKQLKNDTANTYYYPLQREETELKSGLHLMQPEPFTAAPSYPKNNKTLAKLHLPVEPSSSSYCCRVPARFGAIPGRIRSTLLIVAYVAYRRQTNPTRARVVYVFRSTCITSPLYLYLQRRE